VRKFFARWLSVTHLMWWAYLGQLRALAGCILYLVEDTLLYSKAHNWTIVLRKVRFGFIPDKYMLMP